MTRCAECGVAEVNGHLFGCSVAAAVCVRTAVRSAAELAEMAAAVARDRTMPPDEQAGELDRLAERLRERHEQLAAAA
jgi:acyl-CoA reductase-like NAD-dependent aldehyde dehydrogenase